MKPSKKDNLGARPTWSQKDLHDLTTAAIAEGSSTKKPHQQQGRDGNFGRTSFEDTAKLKSYRLGLLRLQKIVELPQGEAVKCLDCSTTSSVAFVRELALSMSQLLCDCSAQSRCISRIQSLLSDYKVVRSLDRKNYSVSLLRIQRLVQDNFPDSFLCLFLDAVSGLRPGAVAKTILFD